MAESNPTVDRVYSETWANIRVTDDISFKLLGTVPLVSGAALLTMLFQTPKLPGDGRFVVALALFAAMITLGLFRWELRNIQTCNWLLKRAEAMECDWSNLPKRPSAPHSIGKTVAEKWVYSATIVLWLSIPVIWPSGSLERWLVFGHSAAALIILFLTAMSAREDVRFKE
jgi:hypothetical protein